jgi:DNA gyrase/topoisomerase IV subunit B
MISAKEARERTKAARDKAYIKATKDINHKIKNASKEGKKRCLFNVEGLSAGAQEKICSDLKNAGYRVIGPMASGDFVVHWEV